MNSNFKIGGVYDVVCKDANGNVKWEDTAKNNVPDAGVNHALDVLLHGATQVSTWYLGLKNTGTPTAADTLASHSSWAENTNYTGDRKEYVEAAASSKTVTNSANKASFAIDTDSQTISGAFLCSVASGTSGTLLSVADFTGGDKSVDDGDTLEVTFTFTGASA